MSITVREVDRGWVLPVRAQPGARRNAVEGEHDGMLKIAVTQKPDKGKANLAIAAQLAKQLGVAKSNCQLLSGATGRSKRFLVVGLTLDELSNRLPVDLVVQV